MTLGSIIKRLESADPDSVVVFDFCNLNPDGVHSWRGVYSKLAIGWSDTTVTVGELLKELKSAVGKTFQGYKGGLYKMHEGTPVHVDNWGRCTGTRVVGILMENEGEVIIETRGV